jgi:copper chaperone CopZ
MKKYSVALAAFIALSLSLTFSHAYGGEKVTFGVGKAKSGWASGAEAAVKKVKGVGEVKADEKAQQVKVSYDPKQTNLNALANALTEAGTTPQLLIKVEGMH